MAQANEIPTTRRAFSKWLAAVGVMAAAPVAAQASIAPAPSAAVEQPTTDWNAFLAPLQRASDEYKALSAEIARREGHFERWERHHPFPIEPLARADHTRRYQNALIQCGFGKLKPELNAAYDRAIDICKEIANTPVRNMADVKAKSRLARFESESGPIHRTFIKELAGEA